MASLPHLTHDRAAYVEVLAARHVRTNRCAVLGASAFLLSKLGETLTVDRIDSRLGYIKGNMQLLCGYLNTAKGVQDVVPQWAINRMQRRLDRLVTDYHSKMLGLQRGVRPD